MNFFSKWKFACFCQTVSFEMSVCILLGCATLNIQYFSSFCVILWFFKFYFEYYILRPQEETLSWSFLKLMSIKSVMQSNHLILCHPLPLLPSIFPNIRVFSSESALHIRWPKYWSLSFRISPSNEDSGLISFRMDWLDLLTVQGTLKSLLQHHSSEASILQPSAFFMVQLSHPYMTAGKTIALTRWTFVGKVMSLRLICCLDWS